MRIGESGRAIVFLFTVAFVVICFASMPISAQTSNSGVITGIVKNEKGELVPNATVRAINIGTNVTREATTSGEGAYEIAQLVPGNYRVEVEASGFAKYVQESVTVNVLSPRTDQETGEPSVVTMTTTSRLNN